MHMTSLLDVVFTPSLLRSGLTNVMLVLGLLVCIGIMLSLSLLI